MRLVIDVSTWTQEEKNYLQAAAVYLLYQYDTRFDSGEIWAKDGVINIPDELNPPADIGNTVLSPVNIKAWLAEEFEKTRIANEEAQKEEQAKEQEVNISEFKDIKLANIDAKIDAIQNIAQLKVLLKKFARFVIARQ